MDDLELEPDLDVPVSDLGLSVRAVNSLAKHFGEWGKDPKRPYRQVLIEPRVPTVREVMRLSVPDLYDIRNVGWKTVEEIQTTLEAYSGQKMADIE